MVPGFVVPGFVVPGFVVPGFVVQVQRSYPVELEPGFVRSRLERPAPIDLSYGLRRNCRRCGRPGNGRFGP